MIEGIGIEQQDWRPILRQRGHMLRMRNDIVTKSSI